MARLRELKPPKYRVGDEVYLYDYCGSTLVTITDVYKWCDKWYYDVDASRYAKGFELEFVRETALGRDPFDGKKNADPYDYLTWRKLYMEYKNKNK